MRRFFCIVVLCALLAAPARASDQPKYIALTFDDGPSGRFTSRLLDGLAERNVHATFFICGYRVEQYPELTARIAEEGHEIGTHGDKHRFFSELSPEGVCRDLQAAQEKIEAACGKSPSLLRPPGGIFDCATLRRSVCAELPVILWSIDPEDWRRSDSAGIAADILCKAESGDIILMHDMSDSSVDAALQVIDALEARGFEFVTVSELASATGTELKGSEKYYRFYFPKNAEISSAVAATEPCTKSALPPPRPRSAAFSSLQKARRSPPGAPMAY